MRRICKRTGTEASIRTMGRWEDAHIMRNRAIGKISAWLVLVIAVLGGMGIPANATIYYYLTPEDRKESAAIADLPTMTSEVDVQFEPMDIEQIESIVSALDRPEQELSQLILAIRSIQQIAYVDQFLIGTIHEEEIIQWLNDLGCVFQEERSDSEIDLFMTDHVWIRICANESFEEDVENRLHSISLLVCGAADGNGEEMVVYTYLF